MLDRRRFLFSSAGVAAAAALAPFAPEVLAQSHAAAKEDWHCHPPGPLPSNDLYARDEEAYWAEVRKQFVLIPQGQVYLNNGTNGRMPWPVMQGMLDGINDTERMEESDPEDYPIWGYGPWNEFRDPLAQFVGCNRDEIALTRNATESNNYICMGTDFKPGDEVLMSDQEHPSGEQPFLLRQKRHGIVVKKYKIPVPPKSPAEIMNAINDAITPRTRMIFTSHISTVTGVIQPVKEIAALARSKGIISAFDGAHVTGMMKLNLDEIGCDMYSSSPHKWLQSPKGTGFLYVRPEMQDRLWNTITTAGWDDPKLKAERFQRIGSSNVPVLWGLRAALKFANDLGMEKIEKRHRAMADYILAEMTKRGAQSWTSPDPAMRCGIATVNNPSTPMPAFERWAWQKQIRVRGGGPSKLRLATPYYLLKPDVERFLAAVEEFRKQPVAA